jgi:hypothetical protein
VDDHDVLKHFESRGGARRRLGAEGAEAAARPGPAAARYPCGVRRARALPSAASAPAAEAGMIRLHRRRISAPSRDRRVTRNPLPWKRARAHAHRALVGLDARRVEVEAHVELTVPGLTIVGLADRACAEAKHRVRSGMMSAELEWPLRRITVNEASHSRAPARATGRRGGRGRRGPAGGCARPAGEHLSSTGRVVDVELGTYAAGSAPSRLVDDVFEQVDEPAPSFWRGAIERARPGELVTAVAARKRRAGNRPSHTTRGCRLGRDSSSGRPCGNGRAVSRAVRVAVDESVCLAAGSRRCEVPVPC